MNTKTHNFKIDSLERVLAIAAVVVCLFLCVRVWQVFGPQQPMWPLPAFYLIETAAISLVALSGIFRGDAFGNLVAWAVVGALLGFAILGGFTIGLFYLPVAAFLSLAALWLDRQAWGRVPLHLGIALVAAVAQAALMLAVIQLMFPSAGS
jgi:hypothetical protein